MKSVPSRDTGEVMMADRWVVWHYGTEYEPCLLKRLSHLHLVDKGRNTNMPLMTGLKYNFKKGY